MKNYFYLIILLIFTSCVEPEQMAADSSGDKMVSTSNKNSAELGNVIQLFCEASSLKDAKKMTNLVYPKLFGSELGKDKIEYMFMRQLKATERFVISNIQMEQEPQLVYSFKKDQFFTHTYSSEVDLKISADSPVSFDDLAKQMTNNDPNAEINTEERSIKFSDKKKILLVKNDQGTYVLPEIFLDFLAIPGLNVNVLKEQFQI